MGSIQVVLPPRIICSIKLWKFVTSQLRKALCTLHCVELIHLHWHCPTIGICISRHDSLDPLEVIPPNNRVAVVSYLPQLLIKVFRESESGYVFCQLVKVDDLLTEEDVVRQERLENGGRGIGVAGEDLISSLCIDVGVLFRLDQFN